MSPFALLADANDQINVWLTEHPAVLGLIAMAIGALLIYFGYAGLQSGTTKDKWGNKMEGGMASLMSIIRLVAGAGACLFGLYKMIAG
jgi:hypothetical protein